MTRRTSRLVVSTTHGQRVEPIAHPLWPQAEPHSCALAVAAQAAAILSIKSIAFLVAMFSLRTAVQ